MKSVSNAMVCGLGASGVGAARLLRAEGSSVLAVDERDTPEGRKNAEIVKALGCTVALGARLPPDGEFDLAVVSPGLSVDAPFSSHLRRRGISLVSEMELGWSRFRGRTLAVTGSNGKSSVVKALAECLQASGSQAIPCGNYGLPVCQAVLESPNADELVIEVSSFQLETCEKFRPDIGVLMNVFPNHLDRHGTFEAYARMKARLFANQCEGDVALTPCEWNGRFCEWSKGRGQWKTFGTEADADFRFVAGHLQQRKGASIDIEGSYFNNDVLGSNAAALLGAAMAAGVVPATVKEVLSRFEPLPHRAQWVGDFKGVRYVNDSKATNLSAMMASIRMQDRPVWLIAGGRPKETDFSAALPLLKQRVKGVLLIGEASSAMETAWGEAVSCETCGELSNAVETARQRAQPGDVVLLAPACTSYDQFRAYAERGDAFRKLASEKS